MKNASLSAVALSLLLSACSSTSSVNTTTSATQSNALNTLYDYQLVNSATKKTTSVAQIADDLLAHDVIFMGEFHSHHAAHKLQLEVLQALYAKNPNIILSMEQFTRDAQPIVDGYLSGKYGEETLLKDGNAWPHYKGSYRAIVEFARINNIEVVAANSPAMHVRCVGRKGVSVLDELPTEQQAWSATNLDVDNPQYQQKFAEFIESAGTSHGQTSEEAKRRMKNTFAAQMLRDTTMAESIIAAHKRNPTAKIVHLNGSFHSDGHLGTVAVVQEQAPQLKNVVFSPVSVANADVELTEKQHAQGDYVYKLLPLPTRYIDKEKQRQSIRALIKQRMAEKCEL